MGLLPKRLIELRKATATQTKMAPLIRSKLLSWVPGPMIWMNQAGKMILEVESS